jgi:hypothetical protein
LFLLGKLLHPPPKLQLRQALGQVELRPRRAASGIPARGASTEADPDGIEHRAALILR